MSLPYIPVVCVSIFIVYAPGGKRRRVNAGPLDGQNLFSWAIIFDLTVPISQNNHVLTVYHLPAQ